MYTTKGKIQNYLTVDISDTLDNQITDWITAVTNYIDNYTGKSFEETVGTVRYFDGNGKNEIQIDDFISISSVEILELNSTDVDYTLTEGANSDYITFPYNDTPKYRLQMTINSQIANFLTGEKRIKITATWGHSSAVPKDIELAATMLVSGIIEKGMKGGTIMSESLGDYSVSYANVDNLSSVLGVKNILDKYKVWEL